MSAASKFCTAVAIIAVAAVVAGCNNRAGTFNSGSSVDGNWMSADGISATRFSGGTFQTTVLKTGETVADGTYRMAGGQTVEITMRSALRQTVSVVNCNLVTPNNLACAGADGQQFALVRRSTS